MHRYAACLFVFFLLNLMSQVPNVLAAGQDAPNLAEIQKAAEQGDVKAQFMLAQMYGSGRGVAKDDVKATQWLRKAAERGLAEAQHTLGVLYELGEMGVTQDIVQSRQWQQKAAEQGYVQAQVKMGTIYALGIGVSQDYYRAAQWFTKASGQGDLSAKYFLSRMYMQGQGVIRDMKIGCKLLHESRDYWIEMPHPIYSNTVELYNNNCIK